MPITLTIGHSSANEPYLVELTELPHLFISFVEEEQIYKLFQDFLKQLTELKSALVGIHKQNKQLFYNVPTEQLFLSNVNADHEFSITNKTFIGTLYKEYQKRSRSLLKNKQVNFTALVVFSEDILSLVIIGSSKKTGLQFMEMLLAGPTVQMHFIVACAASFRNLLNQLAQLNNTIREKLEQKNLVINYITGDSVAAEMVLSGEGLIFFKNRQHNSYTKLYSPK